MLDAVVHVLIRLVLAPAARREVDDARSYRAAVRGEYDRLARSIPREPTLGARCMVRLAAVTVASYRALQGAGHAPAEARALAARLNWRIYVKIAAPAWWVTRLVARDRLRRMKLAMDQFMRFPYASPGYEMAYVDAGAGTVGFDVQRCPAAELFAAQGLSPLCMEAFCDLDYPLADRWGVSLTRPVTLAAGATRCEFRYRQVGEGASP